MRKLIILFIIFIVIPFANAQEKAGTFDINGTIYEKVDDYKVKVTSPDKPMKPETRTLKGQRAEIAGHYTAKESYIKRIADDTTREAEQDMIVANLEIELDNLINVVGLKEEVEVDSE